MLQSRRHVLGQLVGAAFALPAVAQPAGRRFEPTQNEVMGPFYPLARPADTDPDLTRLAGRTGRATGQVIELSGRIRTMAGQPVAGARVEIWQANAAGRYAHPSDANPAPLDPNFQGCALLDTGPGGEYRIVTVKPGAYPGGRRGLRTPHIHFDISGRTDRLITQMYFPDEPLNETDQLRLATLSPEAVTARAADRDAAGLQRYIWDIVLRTG